MISSIFDLILKTKDNLLLGRIHATVSRFPKAPLKQFTKCEPLAIYWCNERHRLQRILVPKNRMSGRRETLSCLCYFYMFTQVILIT